MSEWKYIIVPVVTVILTQIIKFIVESIREKKLKWDRLLNGNGGMPSSHTAFTFSLTATIALGEGLTSPMFAIALIFACIVGYDAMGLRMESGRQAVAINLLTDELFRSAPPKTFQKLKEQLGHKPLEVWMGALFGIASACVITFLLK